MEIINITNNNIKELIDFFNNTNPSDNFTYFDKRSFNIINKHIITIIVKKNNIKMGYGHIDYDKIDDKYWLGLFIDEKYRNMGVGSDIIEYLLYNFNNLYKNDDLYLSVFSKNITAINIYFKYGFRINKYINNNSFIMKFHNNNNTLPVSIGESLDKITILKIKLDKIKNKEKHNYVQNEYNILYKKMQYYIKSNIFFYNLLYDVNLKIWEMQDIFRESDNIKIKNELCVEIINFNDRRFKIKNKINNLHNSVIKEQKGYKNNKCFILTHLGLGDNITSIGAVRYLSTIYDEITVVCKEKNFDNIKEFYIDDKSIKFYIVNDDTNISPKFGFNIEKFKIITKNSHIYLAGAHKIQKPIHNNNILPFNFYKDMNINPQYYSKYFYIPENNISIELFNNLKSIIKKNNIDNYIFIHNSSSNGTLFETKNVIKYIKNINYDNTLIINPCQNEYNIEHKYYDIANQFIFKKLIHYIDIIKNSNGIILSDSSFFCMSINLVISHNNCFYISRNNRNYNHIYNLFNNQYNQIFKQIIY